MAPLFGSSIQRKTIAVIITDAAHGAISAQRATRLPGKRWLKSWASGRAIAMVTLTTATVQMIVLITTEPNAGSGNTGAEVLGALGPSTMPKGGMFWKQGWKI